MALPAIAGEPISLSFCGDGTGPADAAAVSETFESEAVVDTPAEWLVTARPTETAVPRSTVTVRSAVHVAPSAEVEAVIFVPLRARRTQRGAVPAAEVTSVVVAPADARS